MFWSFGSSNFTKKLLQEFLLFFYKTILGSLNLLSFYFLICQIELLEALNTFLFSPIHLLFFFNFPETQLSQPKEPEKPFQKMKLSAPSQPTQKSVAAAWCQWPWIQLKNSSKHTPSNSNCQLMPQKRWLAQSMKVKTNFLENFSKFLIIFLSIYRPWKDQETLERPIEDYPPTQSSPPTPNCRPNP